MANDLFQDHALDDRFSSQCIGCSFPDPCTVRQHFLVILYACDLSCIEVHAVFNDWSPLKVEKIDKFFFKKPSFFQISTQNRDASNHSFPSNGSKENARGYPIYDALML
jgi:hypothetical protein